MKLVYVLHSSCEIVGGTASTVTRAFSDRDKAILFNKKEHRDYYEIDGIYLEEKSLNKIQRIANKIFKIR